MIEPTYHLSPKEVVRRQIVLNVGADQIQQVGIDLTLKADLMLFNLTFKNVEVEQKFNMQECFGITNLRSTLSRRGIFTTSGVFDPGFTGIGGLSLYNMSGRTLRLNKGDRIAQIIIFKGAVEKPYQGYYNDSPFITAKDNL